MTPTLPYESIQNCVDAIHRLAVRWSAGLLTTEEFKRLAEIAVVECWGEQG